MRRTIDRFFEPDFTQRMESRPGAAALPLDVSEEGDNYVVKASLPGFEPDQVNISVTGRNLTIHAETKQEQEHKEEGQLLRERYFGALSRSIVLPSEVNADQAQAEYRNGVLTLTLPKSEVERTKKIPVRTGAS
jgi:HSP20 family protein